MQADDDDGPQGQQQQQNPELGIVLRVDGGFDTRAIFEFDKKLDINMNIRIRHNATTRSRGVGSAGPERMQCWISSEAGRWIPKNLHS